MMTHDEAQAKAREICLQRGIYPAAEYGGSSLISDIAQALLDVQKEAVEACAKVAKKRFYAKHRLRILAKKSGRMTT